MLNLKPRGLWTRCWVLGASERDLGPRTSSNLQNSIGRTQLLWPRSAPWRRQQKLRMLGQGRDRRLVGEESD